MKDIRDVYIECARLVEGASDEYDKHLHVWDKVQEDPEMLTVKINESGAMSYYQGRIDALRDVMRFIRTKKVNNE